MAERRMFTKKITDDDNFTSLSSSAQSLYLHLMMSADDDGFCNQVSMSMFKAHASVQDLEALLSKRYLYQFENGVIVIKHWRMANALRKDRYTPTVFQEELSQLGIKKNGSYTWLPNGCQVVAERLPQDSLGKDSIDKVSIGKVSIDNNNIVGQNPTADFVKEIVDYLNLVCNTKYKHSTPKTKQVISARLNEGFSVDDFKTVIDKKSEEWLGTTMEPYLRPVTLFSTKFESYLNQQTTKSNNNSKHTKSLLDELKDI